jgi:exopolyphosphatase/guanosine-5'-triphosphate,3'-diphosphate pyrophosphatase
MKVAAIDCGTNTVLLLLAEWQPGRHPRLRRLADFMEMPRLGQGLDASGRLQPEAIARGLAALQRQRQRAEEAGAQHIVAIATESVRAAANGDEFLAAAAAPPVGVKLRVVGGDEEARLSYRSVAESSPGGSVSGERQDSGFRSVLDIGGGSTELIVGQGRSLHSHRSVPIGSVRLTERLIRSDPPSPAEQQALIDTIDQAIAALPQPQGDLVALAGTATSVASLHLGAAMPTYDGERIDGMRLAVADLEQLIGRLASLSVAERRALPGLDPRRADVIYAGATILWRIALRAGVSHFTVSDRGVRWGAMEEFIDSLAASA